MRKKKHKFRAAASNNYQSLSLYIIEAMWEWKRTRWGDNNTKNTNTFGLVGLKNGSRTLPQQPQPQWGHRSCSSSHPRPPTRRPHWPRGSRRLVLARSSPRRPWWLYSRTFSLYLNIYSLQFAGSEISGLLGPSCHSM